MKQKNTAIGKAFLCGSAAMLLLAGCVKESAINEKYRPAGTPITFSAATGYENGTGTRTEYSGQLYGNTPKYERIDWLSGDPVTITYVHGTPATSQYQVTEVSGTTDKNSYASVEVASGQTKLTWGEGEGDHTFYAMYPSTDFQGNGSASLTSSNHVQGSVPATQTLHLSADGTKYLPPMQYGYMVAYKNIGGTSTESRVTLPFTPAVTAFEFKLQKRNGDTGNLKIKGAELTATTPLTGTFAFDITGGDGNGATWNTSIGTGATTVTNEGHTVSFTFPVEGGVSLPDYGGETFLDFTVFALPVEQTGLRLKLIYTDDSENVLALNDAPDVPHTFEAAKKHVITNKSVPGDWEYIIEATDPDIFPYTGGTKNATVTSYRQKGNVKEPVAWTVEGYYYDAECTQPVDPADLWITSFGTNGTGEGSVTGATVPVVGQASVPVVTETITQEAQALNSLIANAPAKGSAGNYWNLSNPATGGDHIVESANSYIINATGYYRIPLVMGNSIKNNAPNPDEIAWKGFDGAAVDGGVYKNDWRVLFENYKGNHITDPWLKNQGGTPTSAEIVWEDVEGLVETDDAYNLQNAISADGNWLQFHIPAVRTGEAICPDATTGVLRNEPRQGNAVIAVKDETGTVMWSYHIWVTDYVPKNFPSYSSSSDKDVEVTNQLKYEKPSGAIIAQATLRQCVMSRSLGQVEYGQTITTTYPNHPAIYVKLEQTESSKIASVMFTQDAHTDVYRRDIGTPNWQYGRSAALWPFDNVNETPVWYGKKPSFGSIQGPVTLGQSIQSSSYFLVNGTTGYGLAPISVDEAPDPVTFFDGSSYSFFPSEITLPQSTLPSNLWRADGLMQRLRVDDWWHGKEKYDSSAYLEVIFNETGYVWNKKSIYDPCPAGYHVPNGFLVFVLKGGVSTFHAEKPSESHYEGDTLSGPDLFSYENDKYLFFYTGSEKTNTFPMLKSYYLNATGKVSRPNNTTISMASFAQPSTSTPYRFLPTRIGVSIGGLLNNQASAIRPVDEDVSIDPRVFPFDVTPYSEWIDFLNSYN